MKRMSKRLLWLSVVCLPFFISSCSTYSVSAQNYPSNTVAYNNNQVASPKPFTSYSDRLPSHIATGEKTIVIDPSVHAWGAYDTSGSLIRSGLATAGNSWCPDIKRSCRTRVGTFRIQSLGSASCKSTIYPLPRGGAPMPYCMFFNGNQGLHGSAPGNVVEGNVSHGCVRMSVSDAEWIRFNFARIGTKVIVRPY
ncbi:MAG: L,D-transpeptidase [Gammaproteobacteria bacterium]|nr:L,D-transpeptidase [Gammaproteobacteria bacterium]